MAIEYANDMEWTALFMLGDSGVDAGGERLNQPIEPHEVMTLTLK